jgi:S1-C subfamily serine protease
MSKDETEKKAAIEAISSLTNTQVATNIARIFGGPGARAALTTLATTGSAETKSSIEDTLSDLYREFGGSIVRVLVHTNRGLAASGTGFYVTKEGVLLTAAHLLTAFRDSQADTHFSIEVPDRFSHPAKLMRIVTEFDLAILKDDVPSNVIPLTP